MGLTFKAKARIVYFLISFFAVIIVARLFFIQIVKGDDYKKEAEKQYNASSLEDFDRGSIYFTEKLGNRISAAIVKNGYQVAINPKFLTNHEEVYKKITEVILVDKESFMSKAMKKDDPYEVLVRRIDEETANKIKNMKIAGLNVYSESWRYYPFDNLASHVLGFVGYKEDKLVGRYGIESYYDAMLGRDTMDLKKNSFTELFFDFKKLIAGSSDNGDVVLTIEPTVQSMLDKNLEKVKEKYNANLAGGMIIDPKTGNIIAMAGNPNFNPNQYAKIKNYSTFLNPLVENVIEMGSIMKPLTLAASMDTGSITASTTYTDNGFLVFGSSRIENYDGKARGLVDMQKVLNDSLNTGAVFAMQKMGKDKFKDYMLGYGFGEKTGIELPQEGKNNIVNILRGSRDVEYATASYGQGFAVTPISMAVALSSLANGGFIMKPHIVKEESFKGLKNHIVQTQEVRRVLKKETAEEITRMLVEVVDKALVGGSYKMEHYSVAAKTGTAQLVEKGKKTYTEGEFIHTFFGYAPAFDAKFLTFLFVVKPQGAKYASNTLTEPFMDITKFLLNYYEVAPDR
ncbi:MAG: penicillin-binding protein 2 [Patescibacteria group bacterium]